MEYIKESMQFKEILEEEGLTQRDFAELMGMKEGTVYHGSSRGHKRGAPKWIKGFVLGWTLGRKKSTPDGV